MDLEALRQEFWPQVLDGLALGSIYALIALGYTLVYGVLRLINFAHSEVFMIGIFTSLFVLHALGVEEPLSGVALVGVLILAGLVAMVASGAVALAIERIAYRPLRRRGAPRLAALISAIGMSFVLQEAFALRYGRDVLGFPRVMEKRVLFTVLGADVRSDRLLAFVAAVVLMVALDRFVRRSRLGRGIRAVAQNADVAALMGVNVDRVIALTFLLGGLMAGAAGLFYGVIFETARYDVGFLPGIKAFTAAVLGGIGNMRGAFFGGLLLGLLENLGASAFGGQWRDVFAFTVLVAVLLVRPSGLFGGSVEKVRA
ncbi:MAG: branched-chain amino acid ABC transporter permease [Acidimicrobiia bacterium]